MTGTWVCLLWKGSPTYARLVLATSLQTISGEVPPRRDSVYSCNLGLLLMCVMVIAVGIALSIGLVHDATANSSPLTQGLALIGAALFSALVYYLLVIRRLAREQREGR